jgi:hypothetical protein
MNYLVVLASLAVLGAAAGGAVAAGAYGYGATMAMQGQVPWAGPWGHGQGGDNCTCPADGTGNQYGYGGPMMVDDDGDGIPNCQDEDWVPPLDGTGHQYKHGNP